MLDQGLQRTRRSNQVPQNTSDIRIPVWSSGKCKRNCSNQQTELADGLCITCWDKTVDYNYDKDRARSRPKELIRKRYARKNSSI